MQKTLLHVCCGPCASACVPRLREEGREPVLFFSNCNIATREEHDRRLEAARRLAGADGAELIEDAWDHAEWLDKVARGFEAEPEKGVRCARCFAFSLRRAAERAAKLGIGEFCSSLTVSPHKVSRMVFEAGREAAWTVSAAECGGSAAAGPKFLEADFKKRNGFLASLKRSSELGLYRQPYCGCEFSIKD